MTKNDTYKEFKEWFKNQTKFTWSSLEAQWVDYDDELPFSAFEHEQKEKQKELEIKNIIKKVIEHSKNNCFTVVQFEDRLIDGIYIELKKEGYLK